MTRMINILTVLVITVLAALSVPPTLAAQENDVRADVAISVVQDETIWVGQQITLNLDVKTTGFSFSNTRFNLPEVNGAFLMQIDTTTVKLTEQVDGQSWQIVRYPIALYPQTAGQLEIPPIDVRFSTSAGFGSTEKAFEFHTTPLKLSISLPPGVHENDMVITTAAFELSHRWQPDDAPVKAGDAFTLTVTRRAKNIAAMLFPPLPVYRVAGLAAYPQAPEINDITNRGELTGERIDSIIWVIEKPGNYTIPGIRFQWWDPSKRELKQQIIPGLKLDVRPSAASKTANPVTETRTSGFSRWLIALSLISLTVLLFWKKNGHRSSFQHDDSEKSTFATLKKACRNHQPVQVQSAIYQWLAWYPELLSPDSQTITLSQFSEACGDVQLTAVLMSLQEALISLDSLWQGGDLLNSLVRIRRSLKQQRLTQSRSTLAALNPQRNQRV